MARETLTALLDGECTPAEMDRLLEELAASPGLMLEYSRQIVAREAREGTRILKDQPCICAGVMAGLDDMDEPASPKVVDLDSRRPRPQPPARPSFWKPLAGLAAAASVAAVAVLISMPGQTPDSAAGMAAASSPAVTPSAIVPVALPMVRTPGLRSVALRPEELRQRDELSEMLLEHNGSMAEQGMGGTLRYARFAAHTAEYRPSGDQP